MPDPTPLPGPRLGEYQLLGELARGGVGVVYRARHLALGMPVAIKVLHAGRGADARARERFRIEAQAAARLYHPNIVAIHDVGEEGGCPYLVMDLVEGEPLDAVLERQGPLPPRQAAELVCKLAEALHYAHEHLILHRDVKPANVLLARGEPLLTDFGMAKLLDGADGPSVSGQLLGTPEFMAPEQAGWGGGEVDGRADVYGLGATLYALLVGEPPLTGRPLELLGRLGWADPEPPSSRASGLDRDLDTVCLTCLEKEPERRYASAASLAADLRRYLAHEPIEARPLGLLGRARKWTQRNPLAIRAALAATLLLALASGGALAWVTRARQAEQATLALEAAGACQEAWSRVEVAEAADLEQRMQLALDALWLAQRWRDQDPSDPAAAKAQYRAGWALGEVARAGEQWALASQAFWLARVGVDDDRVEEALAELQRDRRQESEQRRAHVEGLLAEAASGALAERPDGIVDATFAIVQHSDPQTVALLTGRLDAVSEALESATPQRPPPGSSQQRSNDQAVRRLGLLQRERVGQGPLDMARLCCESLGRIGDPAAVPSLRRYLLAELDQLRAVPPARALCRLGGRDGLLAVIEARRYLGLGNTFSKQVLPLLAEAARAAGLHFDGDEGSTLTHLARAELFHLQGDLARARQALERALELQPDDPDTHNYLGSILKAEGRLAEAIQAYTRALQLAPRASDMWNNRGATREQVGDLQGALDDLTRSLELDDTNPAAWGNRGIVYRKLGDDRRAVADYSRALELDPTQSLMLSKRALARMDLGDPTGALEDLQRAIELDPDFALLYNNRAWVWRRQSQLDAALADYTRAIELDPNYPLAWVNRADVFLQRGDTLGALEDYERFLELVPQHPRAADVRRLIAQLRGGQ